MYWFLLTVTNLFARSLGRLSLPDRSPMADASDMCATEHPPFDRVKAGKAPGAPDSGVSVDAGAVESAAVMKPEVLETLATKPMKDRGRAVR